MHSQYITDRRCIKEGRCPDCLLPLNAKMPKTDLSGHYPACARITCNKWFEITNGHVWRCKGYGLEYDRRKEEIDSNKSIGVDMNRDREDSEKATINGLGVAVG